MTMDKLSCSPTTQNRQTDTIETMTDKTIVDSLNMTAKTEDLHPRLHDHEDSAKDNAVIIQQRGGEISKNPRWWMGGVSDCTAALVTHPMDMMKTQLQSQQFR